LARAKSEKRIGEEEYADLGMCETRKRRSKRRRRIPWVKGAIADLRFGKKKIFVQGTFGCVCIYIEERNYDIFWNRR